MAEAIDYLLEAALGAAQGFEKGYDKYSDFKYKDALDRRKLEATKAVEMGMFKEKLPLETAAINERELYKSKLEKIKPQGSPGAYSFNEITGKYYLGDKEVDAATVPQGVTVNKFNPTPKPTKTEGEKNAKQIDSLQGQLDEINNVHKAVKVLRSQFEKNATPSLNSGAKVLSKITPDSWTPETTAYVGLKKQLQPRVAFALIGSKQGLQGMGKSEGSEIPDLTWDQKLGKTNFDRLEQQFIDKKNTLKKRIQKYGGTPVDEEGINISDQKDSNQIPQKNSKGWELHTDKNGQNAYVSPDGSQFEEVK